MDTIVISFEDNKVVVTNGRQTSTSSFNKIIDKSKRALIALAEFFEYEPAHLLDFEGLGEYKFEDDDDDFLQGLADEAETEEMIKFWLEQLLESTGKSNIDELTTEEILSEIEEVKDTIRNEEIVIGISEFAEKNIEQYKAYLKILKEMLNNKEVI